jgi:hypothetical protein
MTVPAAGASTTAFRFSTSDCSRDRWETDEKDEKMKRGEEEKKRRECSQERWEGQRRSAPRREKRGKGMQGKGE